MYQMFHKEKKRYLLYRMIPDIPDHSRANMIRLCDDRNLYSNNSHRHYNNFLHMTQGRILTKKYIISLYVYKSYRQ